MWRMSRDVMSHRPSRARGDIEGETRIGFRMAGIGFEVASEVAAGSVLGWLVDLWVGSAPRGLLTGSILGIAVGMWSLIQGTMKLNRELDRKHPTAGRGRPIPPSDEEAPPDDSDHGNDDRSDRQ